MTIQRAITVLKEHNEWRRHEGEPCPSPHSSQELGLAIDLAIHYLWKIEKILEIINFGDGIEPIN